MGGKAKLREGKAKLGPLITDNGNFILDVDFGIISNPKNLSANLKALTGVIDSGLFTNMINKAYIGQKDGTVKIIDQFEKKNALTIQSQAFIQSSRHF